MKMFSHLKQSFILFSGGKNLQFLHFEHFQQVNFLFEIVTNIINDNIYNKLKKNIINLIQQCGKASISSTVIHITPKKIYT